MKNIYIVKSIKCSFDYDIGDNSYDLSFHTSIEGADKKLKECSKEYENVNWFYRKCKLVL